MNPELYERYLAKKAKKLGITVEELKAQGTSSPVKETVTTSTSQATPVATQSSVSSNYTQPSVQPQPVPQPQYPLPEQTQYQTQSQVAQSQSQSQFASQSQTQYYSQPQYVQQTIQEQLAQQQTQQIQMPLQQPTTQFSTSTQSQFVQSVQPQQPSSQYEQVQQSEQIPQHVEYSGMRQETVKTDVPSYIFGPSRMTEPPKYSSSPISQSAKPEEPIVKDNRENKFGLIGYPLGHSLSKVIHEAGFKSLGVKATYDILETPPDTLVDRVKFLKGNGYKGFNVTIPLKLPISLFVNEVDKYADLARAVNTIYVEADKSLKAYNTDVLGFKRAIPNDISLAGKKVAILGTGGAAHAACVALTECRVKEIAFFTRNIPNSIDLMNYVRRKFPSIDFNVYQIENIRSLREFSMLVNTTPIGMLGKAGDMSPLEYRTLESLERDAVVYDVIYNPKKTVLIKDAQAIGLRTITGLDMLIYQAVAAQEIWFGQTPDFKDMKIAALEAL